MRNKGKNGNAPLNLDTDQEAHNFLYVFLLYVSTF